MTNFEFYSLGIYPIEYKRAKTIKMTNMYIYGIKYFCFNYYNKLY